MRVAGEGWGSQTLVEQVGSACGLESSEARGGVGGDGLVMQEAMGRVGADRPDLSELRPLCLGCRGWAEGAARARTPETHVLGRESWLRGIEGLWLLKHALLCRHP